MQVDGGGAVEVGLYFGLAEGAFDHGQIVHEAVEVEVRAAHAGPAADLQTVHCVEDAVALLPDGAAIEVEGVARRASVVDIGQVIPAVGGVVKRVLVLGQHRALYGEPSVEQADVSAVADLHQRNQAEAAGPQEVVGLDPHHHAEVAAGEAQIVGGRPEDQVIVHAVELDGLVAPTRYTADRAGRSAARHAGEIPRLVGEEVGAGRFVEGQIQRHRYGIVQRRHALGVEGEGVDLELIQAALKVVVEDAEVERADCRAGVVA